jgi:hypothetical protein
LPFCAEEAAAILRGGGAQAEPNKCGLAFEVGVGDFGGPDLEEVEDAILAVGSDAVEIGAGDRRVAASEFGNQSLKAVSVGLRPVNRCDVRSSGSVRGSFEPLHEPRRITVCLRIGAAGSPCAALGGGIHADGPVIDLISAARGVQADPERFRQIERLIPGELRSRRPLSWPSADGSRWLAGCIMLPCRVSGCWADQWAIRRSFSREPRQRSPFASYGADPTADALNFSGRRAP